MVPYPTATSHQCWIQIRSDKSIRIQGLTSAAKNATGSFSIRVNGILLLLLLPFLYFKNYYSFKLIQWKAVKLCCRLAKSQFFSRFVVIFWKNISLLVKKCWEKYPFSSILQTDNYNITIMIIIKLIIIIIIYIINALFSRFMERPRRRNSWTVTRKPSQENSSEVLTGPQRTSEVFTGPHRTSHLIHLITDINITDIFKCH